jgi:hypothetical protein
MSMSQKELINVSFPYDSIIDESSILIRLELELQYLIIDCLYIHRALIIYLNFPYRNIQEAQRVS